MDRKRCTDIGTELSEDKVARGVKKTCANVFAYPFSKLNKNQIKIIYRLVIGREEKLNHKYLYIKTEPKQAWFV